VSRLRIALVGAGARARIWRRVIDADPRTTLAGLADTDPAALAGETLPTAPTLEALLERSPADAVLLATPPAGRGPQIAAACAARLPILAEKPLADSLAAATAHVAAADAAGVPIMVGLNFRYLPVTRALKGLIADTLGPPEFARFTYERWRDGHRPGINRYPLAMAQPMLWEQSIHHFDLLRFVYGAEPVRRLRPHLQPLLEHVRG
jgi:predicted dehydrogenase